MALDLYRRLLMLDSDLEALRSSLQGLQVRLAACHGPVPAPPRAARWAAGPPAGPAPPSPGPGELDFLRADV
jgi:hypothetical protein